MNRRLEINLGPKLVSRTANLSQVDEIVEDLYPKMSKKRLDVNKIIIIIRQYLTR